jgi:hypothetical protein
VRAVVEEEIFVRRGESRKTQGEVAAEVGRYAVPAIGASTAGAVVIGAAANVVQTVATSLAHPGEAMDPKGVAMAGVWGGIGGGISGGASGGYLIQKYTGNLFGSVFRNLGASAVSNKPTGDTCGCK